MATIMKTASHKSGATHQPLQNQRSTRNHLAKGFSLIEVLVAIVVLSIGLLGLAGLQTAGLKANNSANQRSLASAMANDILDRMRANQTGLLAGFYNDPYAGGTPADPNCFASAPYCDIEQMADYDVYYWETSLSDALPNGQGKITGNGGGSVFTVTVMWDDNRTGATGTTCPDTPDPDNELTCFMMSTRL